MVENRVGLIGVGLLGTAMAERLREAGFPLLAYDIDRTRRVDASHLAHFLESIDNVFAQCKTILLCLPNSNIVREVVSCKVIQRGSLIIDTTTGDPNDSIEFGNELSQRSVAYLDTTIAGSSAQMRRGEAVGMVGGTKDGYQRAETILDVIAPKRSYLGRWGSGAKMKLVVNLAIGLNRAVLAEALSLAQVLELDLSETLKILQKTAAYSAVMDSKGVKMIEREFEPQARLAQHSKDVELMLNAAKRSKHELPLSSLHQSILLRLIDEGCGELDNSVVFKAFEYRGMNGANWTEK